VLVGRGVCFEGEGCVLEGGEECVLGGRGVCVKRRGCILGGRCVSVPYYTFSLLYNPHLSAI